MITYPSTHGVFEDAIHRHLRHHSRAWRPGLHGRREHERAGRPHEPGEHRRRRVPPQPPQDVRHPARRRRSRHGPDRRGGAPRAVPAGPPSSMWCPAMWRPASAGPQARPFPPVSAAPWGSASILLISLRATSACWARKGVTDSTRYAILNANYIKSRLEKHYDVLYTRENGRVAHEMIFDLRAVQGEGRRGRRRGQAPDGLRLPRAHGVVPGARARS